MPVWINDPNYHYYTAATTTTSSSTTGFVLNNCTFRNCTATNTVTVTNCTSNGTWYGNNVGWQDWEAEPQPINRPIEPVRTTVRPTPVHTRESHRKAAELLDEHLTEEQRKTLKERNWFVVQGGKSGKPYRIERGRGLMANVAVLKDDHVEHRLCAHLGSGIPEDDHLLAQKLWLEHAEDEFVQRANRHAA